MIREFAPAKLNLYLHVTGRREDGYHLLDSLVAFADIGDWVEVEAASGYNLTIDGPMAAGLAREPVENNLITRSVWRLADQVGCAPDLTIRLTKNLPLASGIGGGSADAAAALRAVARLWGISVDAPELLTTARGVGQDVPVCVGGAPCYFRGIGDELDPAPALPETCVVLANPGVAVPTPEVFRGRKEAFSPAARLPRAAQDAADLALLLAERRNDLAAPAQSLAPTIGEALAALQATPDCLLARMSGSGATCFGLYATPAAAQKAAEAVLRQHPSWWVTAGALRKQEKCA